MDTVSFVHGSTKVVGVFGHPVEHSLSPAMHNAAFAVLRLPYIYVPFSVRPQALGPALQSLDALGIIGVNLTIPHKEHALSLVDELTPAAREVGAVNTVHCVAGRLVGDNTDGQGFFEPLRELGLSMAGRQAVVIGAGGAARSVVFRLAHEGARIVLVNRTRERARALAQSVLAQSVKEFGPGATVRTLDWEDGTGLTEALVDAHLLVQTTRIGMHPESDLMPPIPPSALHPGLLVYDLIYNPMETRLLRSAREQGCRTLSGVKMLVYQGAAAFQRWTGQWPPTEVMEAAVRKGLEARR